MQCTKLHNAMEHRKYPVDTQTFDTIINGNYVYLDKTDLIYKMVNEFRYVFLSRPRRFGKSLLCSTLKEYFSGNKELFKGLYIDKMETEWTKYPVIHLDFSSCKTTDLRAIKKYLSKVLADYEHEYSLITDEEYETEWKGKNDIEDISNIRLGKIVESAYKKFGQKVVVIIDEYDALMLNTIHDDDLQDKIREQQNNLFSPLKELDPYLRFVFITGITKFSQMSIFSTLNNLHDISLLPDYERLCGISMDEFVSQLKNGLKDFADYNGYTFDETVQRFKNKYDGYHFSFLKQDVFNPFSVIKALNDKMLNNYWFGSATPSALLKLIRKFDFSMENFEMIECDSDRFNQPVEKVTDLIPFLFQSGYLTIKDYNREYDLYTLGFPNEEVRSSTAKTLFNYNYQNTDTVPLKKSYIDFSKSDDLDKFIEALKKFFRRFPFSLNNMNEKHYHSILYTVLTSFGADISANQETALGKSDLILKMPKTVYVIELKYDRSVESALAQIDDRDYTAAVLDDKKRIVKLAIKFSEKDRNIVDYKAVEVKN